MGSLEAVAEPENQSPLPRFLILVYERDVPNSSAEVSPTFLQAHMHLPRQIAETGGRIVAGHATRPASAGVSVRDNVVTGGSLAEGERALAGYFLVEASDLDHAVWIGRMIPVVDGWVEVRPLVTA